MTMREKMAKAAFERMAAIMRQRYPARDESLITDETWETTGPQMRLNWLAAIDAALAALRDPTPEMIQAGERITDGYYSADDDFKNGWQAAVDAALTAQSAA